MKTVLDTLEAGAGYLASRGVEVARLNMEQMLAHLLGCRRLDLYLDFDRPLDEGVLGPLRELVKRRGAGEPLQHLLGTVDFYGREFLCDGRALIPRPETEELVGLLVGLLGGEPPEAVVDVGCGSGVIGLSLAAEWAGAAVWLVDRSAGALGLARENAARLGLVGEGLAGRVEFFCGDLLAPVAGRRAGLIVANLPYIPAGELAGLDREVRHDPVMALDGGEDGLELVRRLVAEVGEVLGCGGTLALEIGAGQGRDVASLCEAAGLVGVEVVVDLSGEGRFVVGRAI